MRRRKDRIDPPEDTEGEGCEMMQIVFASNFMNHHQLPLALALREIPGVDFVFVATEPVPEERLELGYEDMNREYGFVLCAYESRARRQRALRLCRSCDILIVGSAPERYARGRLRDGKLTFRYSERIYKKECPLHRIPLELVKHYLRSGRHQNLHMLCASAFTAVDFAKTRTFLGKTYKWGYFPEAKRYEEEYLMARKGCGPVKLLWAGRFLDWKHPDDAVRTARRLKESGIPFALDIIGTGELEQTLRDMIRELELGDCVHLLGSMPPEQVREHMEQADIYLFTSDRNEGWGAVLNEAMNSACAVVASHAIGAVPFLMKEGENGLVYESGNVGMLFEKVKYLAEHPQERVRMGMAAYRTITETWNAQTAAQRLVALLERLLSDGGSPEIFEDGPCAKATILQG